MSDLPKIDIRPDHWEIVRGILQKHAPQYEVWAFGSRAKWTAKEYSDLDLAVITDKPLSLETSANLSDEFSESDLPWKVDVVDWATTSEAFRRIIERDRVVLQKGGGRGLGKSAEWPLVAVEDVCSLIVDCVNKTAPVSPVPTPFRMIRTTNVRNGRIDLSECRYVDEATYERWTRRSLLEPGDVILTREAPIGEVGLVKDSEGVFLGQRLMQYRANNKLLDGQFLLYAFLSPHLQHQFRSHEGSGSVVSHIRVGDCFKFKLRLPPLYEQRDIAEVLSSLDDKIELNRSINQTLEQMAQAIFKSWFVDFDPVKAKVAARQEGRDPLRAAMSAISGKADAKLDALPREQFDQLAATAALFPEEMEESEFGEIPRGWTVSKVETLLTRLPAKTRYTKEKVSYYGHTPVYEQGASILLGYHDEEATYQASVVNPFFIFGDHTCVTRLSCQPFDISQNVIPLCGRDRATLWVYYAVKEKQKFQEYRRHWMELISKDVVVASPSTCSEFAARVSTLHLQIEANERQIRELTALRDILLPKLLSGELSIGEDMELAELTDGESE